jgi:hypothetical protein
MGIIDNKRSDNMVPSDIVKLARDLRHVMDNTDTEAEHAGAIAAVKQVATTLGNLGVVDEVIFLALTE